MINLFPSLYGQSNKHIRVWLYIDYHNREGRIFTYYEICKVCFISKQGLYDILIRGVDLLQQQGISVLIKKPSKTSPDFLIEIDNMITPNIKKILTPKKEKIEVETEVDSITQLAENIIITHLNQITGKAYRLNNKVNSKLIQAKLKQGFTVEQFKYVIEVKHFNWKDTEFEKYLQPSTLFGNKFENYLNEKYNTDNSRDTKLLEQHKRLIEADWNFYPKPEGD